MTSMVSVFNKNAIFMGLSLMLIVALGLALIYIPTGELHLLLCDHHTPARDIFYRYYTQLAEWLPYVICVLLLLFSRVLDGITATASLALSALVTQLIKHIVKAPRPLQWFADKMPDVQLPLVEGVRMNYWFSFPSGHTTSFFALTLVLSIIATKKIAQRYEGTRQRIYSASIQLLLFVAAAVGAYSRIYLSQHFALDILVGMIIGIAVTLLSEAYLSRFEDKKWANYHFFAKKV